MADIFDVIDEPKRNAQKQGDIFDIVEEQEQAEYQGQGESKQEKQPWYKSIPLDILKGLMEGVGGVASLVSLPAQFFGGARMYPPGVSEQSLTQRLDESLPTDSNMVGKGLRRTLNVAGPALVNPAASARTALMQSTAAGALGQGAEELGFGTGVQTAAEIAPFFFGGGTPGGQIQTKSTAGRQAIANSRFVPEKIRKIAEKSARTQNETNELIEFARRTGMTPEEITPLIQSQTKGDVLSKIAQKRGAPQRKLERTRTAISSIADYFKTGEFANVILKPESSTKMISRMQTLLSDMPASVRNVIMEDFTQLASSDMSTKALVKFFRDINHNYGRKTRQLGLLKEPIREAMASVSPNLANDFNLTNKLFERYFDISSKLKPSVVSDILDLGSVPAMLYGAMTGNYGVMTGVVGEVAARKFASEMLLNPRLQDISRKMVSALNKGQFAVADRIKEEYIRLLKDDFPEISAAMQKETFKELAGDE